jgi:hypothetical protein
MSSIPLSARRPQQRSAAAAAASAAAANAEAARVAADLSHVRVSICRFNGAPSSPPPEQPSMPCFHFALHLATRRCIYHPRRVLLYSTLQLDAPSRHR